MIFQSISVINQKISIKSYTQTNHSLFLKREDLIHPYISGNKFRKLKYNLLEAKEQNCKVLLTFGGAFSNHIAAVASAGKEFGLKTIGIIRGEEVSAKIPENPTLGFAESCGMLLHFISREDYSRKAEPFLLEALKEKFGNFYILPEGGTNELAIKGCEEILLEGDEAYDYICVPVGTGGTIAGIVKSSKPHQTILGFSALRGVFQTEEIKKHTSKTNFKVLDDFCFGGYAKIDSELIRFINNFKAENGILLDPIYTGKMMFGVFELLKKGYFKENSSILAIHTGGLQGIAGMNQKLKTKNLPIINF